MNDEAPNLGGRPPFVPTDELRERVKMFKAVGIPQPDIARSLGICENTLLKYFKPELESGATDANFLVGKTLFEKATKDKDTTALIWWSKTRMGWKEQKDDPPEGGVPRVVITGGLPDAG